MTTLTISEAVRIARTGDLFLFRGTTPADWAIRTLTNAPVNHVGMAVVLEDLPPLMWHAELGANLTCLWSGTKHRGVQLHDLAQACTRWMTSYAQLGWMRQLSPAVSAEQEAAVLKVIARMDGVGFPSTIGLMRNWVSGRARRQLSAQQVYCAEVVAQTYQAMGLIGDKLPRNWYDPGKFWSGDELALQHGYLLGDEIPLEVGSDVVELPKRSR